MNPAFKAGPSSSEGLTQGVHLVELLAGDRREVIRLVVAE